jgi:uncharacterized protein YndB with AHSA1/START domain
MTEPLRITFEVDCPSAHAFEVWTRRIGTWWPRSHTVSGAPDALVTLEPRVGGRIFERTSGGVEHDWGEVLVFEPPHRLSYLWHIRRDRADATEVDVVFRAIGARSTRIEIEHRGWERLGADAEPWRDRNRSAWESLLPHYQALALDPAGRASE